MSASSGASTPSSSRAPPLPPGSSRFILPQRGGKGPVYGIYLGGSPLNNKYLQSVPPCLTYRFASQRRHVKTISSIEQQLVNSRDSITTLKFDGRLEPIIGSSTEIGKARFLTLLARRVEEHGQETFYYAKNANDDVVNLLEYSHNFTVEMIVAEYEERSRLDNLDHSAFDAYEMRDITLLRLVFESLLTSAFYKKIFIRYGHREDFKQLPGSGLLMTALETCNASVSHDIDSALDLFQALTSDSYPGENVSDYSTKALRLIKIMQGGYALPVHGGSRLLTKVSKTSSEEFNRNFFALMDSVKTLEYSYKVFDPLKLI